MGCLGVFLAKESITDYMNKLEIQFYSNAWETKTKNCHVVYYVVTEVEGTSIIAEHAPSLNSSFCLLYHCCQVSWNHHEQKVHFWPAICATVLSVNMTLPSLGCHHLQRFYLCCSVRDLYLMVDLKLSVFEKRTQLAKRKRALNCRWLDEKSVALKKTLFKDELSVCTSLQLTRWPDSRTLA